jgi:hypothetical protein
MREVAAADATCNSIGDGSSQTICGKFSWGWPARLSVSGTADARIAGTSDASGNVGGAKGKSILLEFEPHLSLD